MDVIDLISSSPESEPKSKGLVKSTGNDKLKGATNNPTRRSRGLDLDDDIWSLDTSYLATTSTNVISTRGAGTLPDYNGPTGAPVQQKEKENKDFFFLSDDFDTTLDIDTSCGNVGRGREPSPARKRRRITPEPSSQINRTASMASEGGSSRTLSGTIRLRVRGPSGASTVTLNASATVGELRSSITAKTALTSYDVKYGYPSKALHLGSDEQPLFLLDVALDGEQLTITARDEPTPSRARVSDFLVDDFSSPVIVRRNEQGSLRVTETAPKPPVSKASVIGKPKTSVLEEDPIIFTSSPDYGRAARQKKPINESRKGKGLLDLDPLSSDVEVVVTTRKSTSLRVEAFSSDDLPDIDALVSQDVGRVPTLSRKGSKRALAEYEAEKEKVSKRKERLDEKDSPKKPRKKLTEEEKAQAAQEKLDAKEAEKERKRLARDDKARAKQMAADLAKVNTLRIHKSQATPEMIIDLPLDLEARLAEQVRQFLAPLEVECTDRSSPIPNVVRWRRKVEAIYNKDKDYWEPCRKHIQDEEHVLCVMTAKEFVERATAAEGHDLDAHVLRMQAAFSGKTIIYLLEGLTSWMRKNRNVRNKQFTEAVRAQLDTSTAAAPPSSSSSGRAKKPPPQYIDEDLLEDALLRLQVIHHTLIHHTAAPIETAEWLRAFTQHVATVPYRRARLRVEADAGFCMEAGQISVGVDASDTFVQMLLQVARVTAPVAYAVRDRYGSVQGLIKGFEREGRDCLAEVRKNVHDGGVSGMVESERRIGVRMSRRLYAIFMGRDERSEDI